MVSDILVHVCCGPCACGCIPELLKQGYHPHAFSYNPNIHPFSEYQKRLCAARFVLKEYNIPHTVDDTDYDPSAFIEALDNETGKRCEYCYRTRFLRTAQSAIKLGISTFTTTLTISPWQDHELIKNVGNVVSEITGVSFLYMDFRPCYYKAKIVAKEMSIYRQKYCGCAYSYDEALKESTK